MAIPLEDKPNVTSPGGNYPYGDIKDNPGDNSGTPVNREVYADFHQFFAKILDAGSIVPNGLLENQANGFQYFDALIANIRATAATEALAGTVERATQGEVDTGTDNTRYVTPDTLANSATVLGIETGPKLLTKEIEIGDWNMDTTTNVSVAHGIDASKIRDVQVMIRNDAAPFFHFSLMKANSLGVVDGFFQVDVTTGTDIFLERRTGGQFDSVNYSSTPYNRGWILLTYVA